MGSSSRRWIAHLPTAGASFVLALAGIGLIADFAGTSSPQVTETTPIATVLLAVLALLVIGGRRVPVQNWRKVELAVSTGVAALALWDLAGRPGLPSGSALTGHPSHATDLGLVLLAAAIGLISPKRPMISLAVTLLLIVGVMSLYRLLALLIGHGGLHMAIPFKGMSMLSALSLAVLSGGLFLQPRLPFARQLTSGGLQGRLLRKSLPWALLVPVLLAMALSVLIAAAPGQRGPASAALAVILSALLCVLLWTLTSRLQVAEAKRHAAEQTLKDGKAYANQIIDMAPEAMIIVNLEGRIERTNRRLQELLGYAADELAGQPLEILIPERFRGGHGASRRGYFAAPKARFMGEGRDLFALRKDGSEVAVEIGLAPLNTSQGPKVVADIVDITERLRAHAQLEAMLQEKTVLLNEVHHRVKNNLQVVASLLSLQASNVADAEFSGLIAESEGRVRAMALMHQVLYEHKNFARVRLDVYLTRLTTLLAQIYGATQRGIAVSVDADDLTMELTRAIPLGLVVNELLGNAFKHAFDGTGGGKVTVELRRIDDGQARLTVRDDGRGLPADWSWERSDSLGMQIVQVLSEQIGANLDVSQSTQAGACFDIVFSLEDVENATAFSAQQGSSPS